MCFLQASNHLKAAAVANLMNFRTGTYLVATEDTISMLAFLGITSAITVRMMYLFLRSLRSRVPSPPLFESQIPLHSKHLGL